MTFLFPKKPRPLLRQVGTHDAVNQEQDEGDVFSPKPFSESLPVQATSNDAREFTRILKNKGSSISFVEVLNTEPKRLFEPRKIEAYEYWGVVAREGDRLKLTSLGNRLAESVINEGKLFEEIISSIMPYCKLIRWVNSQRLEVVTHSDVIDFLKADRKSEQSIRLLLAEISEAEVVSFFSLCHAAGFGVTTIGKRGQPTRLRVDGERIEKFLSRNRGRLGTTQASREVNRRSRTPDIFDPRQEQFIERIYVSEPPPAQLTGILFDALELADFESIHFSESETGDYLQTKKLQQMQSCQAGIIIINEPDCCSAPEGETRIRSERMAEITAAAGVFRWRLVLIWNSLLAPPEFLRRENMNLLILGKETFETIYQSVRLLKEMRANGQASNSNE